MPGYIWVVQGNYGDGWEDVTAEEDRAQALQRLREYRENEPQYPHRVRYVREGWTMPKFEEYLDRKRREYGEKFSDAELWPQFRSWYETGQRVQVTTTYGDGSTYVRTGTVGITTGWVPAFLLMHRSSDHGSSDLLRETDRVTTVKRGKTYRPLQDGEDAYGRIVGASR